MFDRTDSEKERAKSFTGAEEIINRRERATSSSILYLEKFFRPHGVSSRDVPLRVQRINYGHGSLNEHRLINPLFIAR